MFKNLILVVHYCILLWRLVRLQFRTFYTFPNNKKCAKDVFSL